MTPSVRLMLGSIYRIRKIAPSVSWPLVTELLQPIGKTMWLGY